MNKQQAFFLIKETFEHSFEKSRFTAFIKNLLKRVEDAPFAYQGNIISDSYKPYVNKLERICKYKDPEGNRIDVLVIRLQKELSLEHARTMQRNFVAGYLQGKYGSSNEKEAALVAFISPDDEDWRFSLVKMDYKFGNTPSGKIRVKEEFTHARRWSFLVGVSEKSHTAQSRLVNMLANDLLNPTLAELEQAFDIETVSKEFFLKYRELFIRTKEELDKVILNDAKIKLNFEVQNINAVDFAKKLLGQIIFLYFLQKKGWFGVSRDADWGTGSKHFLRELFKRKHGEYKNFFNDVLEPLFYEALRKDRSDEDDYYSRFNCKIPFLNGGLFDPISDYDWVHTDIIIPDNLFSNIVKTKEGDIGDGILDVFDRYNFTVREDEPLEKEVAIDPELLGKAYEKFNAIRPDNFEEYKKALRSGNKGDENKFNKQYGVYYTPREIVHYMCQQSLIHYLAAELKAKISKEDIEKLIHLGEEISPNDARVVIKGKETETYSYKLPECIRHNAKLIDQKLAEITVCDPAVGSGAFPVGMMSEIVRTRNVLSTFIQDNKRTNFEFKRECIERSLYGVDIDPGAVEIAKLRLWLSLIVDEDDIKQIKPLPNLDYKIMQGNSLLEEFEGIKLFDEKLFADDDTIEKENQLALLKQALSEIEIKHDTLLRENKLTKSEKNKLENESKKIAKLITLIVQPTVKNSFWLDALSEAKKKAGELQRLHKDFFKSTHKKEKDDFKKRIEALEWSLIETTLKEQGKASELKKFIEIKKSNLKPFFLWKLHFSEVFEEKNGFDVVIANPPYGLLNKRQNKTKSIMVKENDLQFYKNSNEFAPAISGMVNIYRLFIVKSINILKEGGIFSEIFPLSFIGDISAAELRRYILENTSIDFIEAFPERDDEKRRIFETVKMSVCILNLRKVTDKSAHFFVRIHHDRFVENMNSKALFDLKTICLLDEKSLTIPLMSQEDIVLISKIYKTSIKFSEIGHCFTGELDLTLGKTYLTADSRYATLIKGAIIDKYLIRKEMSQGEIMFLDSKKYLAKNKGDKLKHHEHTRIVMQGITGVNETIRLKMTVLQPGVFCANSSNYILFNNPDEDINYFLGILNSRLLNFIFIKFSTNSNVNGYEVDNLPIPKNANDKTKSRISTLVQKILDSKCADAAANTSTLEKQIDQMVYQLYGLTNEDIAVVEGEF